METKKAISGILEAFLSFASYLASVVIAEIILVEYEKIQKILGYQLIKANGETDIYYLFMFNVKFL